MTCRRQRCLSMFPSEDQRQARLRQYSTARCHCWTTVSFQFPGRIHNQQIAYQTNHKSSSPGIEALIIPLIDSPPARQAKHDLPGQKSQYALRTVEQLLMFLRHRFDCLAAFSLLVCYLAVLRTRAEASDSLWISRAALSQMTLLLLPWTDVVTCHT